MHLAFSAKPLRSSAVAADTGKERVAIEFAQLDFSLYAMRDFCRMDKSKREDGSETLGKLRGDFGLR